MLTETEIKKFIDEYKVCDKRRQAMVGQKYYEAEHDILNYRLFYYNSDGMLVEDKTRANARISHPFFTELVDQLPSYMLSFEKNPIQAKENVDGLQDYLDEYFNYKFWGEIQELIAGTYTKGYEYMYAYKDRNDKLAFECADSLGVVEVRAKDTDDGCQYIIYFYEEKLAKSNKTIVRIQVHTPDEIHYFVQNNRGKVLKDESEPINPKPNILYKDEKTGKLFGKGLGFIPFWRLDLNRKQLSGLKPIKSLIDDYDLMECGLSNNLTDFDTPIHVVSGFQGDDLTQLQQNLKTKKIIGVDEGGGIDVKTVDIPYQARKTKADEDEKNIYRFGMGLNSSQAGDGNITNIVIKSRYTLLDLKANKLETRVKTFLEDNVIQVVLNEINDKYEKDYQLRDIVINFERNIPTNESENVQNEFVKAQTKQLEVNTILSAATVIGDEEVLRAMCDVFDLNYDDLKHLVEEKQEIQNLFGAENDLDGIDVNE